MTLIRLIFTDIIRTNPLNRCNPCSIITKDNHLMLDIKFIRENPELVRQGIKNKNEADKLDDLLKLDEQRRELILTTDELKHKRNEVSSQIPKMKKAGEDVTEVLAEMKTVSDQISILDSQLKEIESKVEDILMFIPNMPHESVPVGKSF